MFPGHSEFPMVPRRGLEPPRPCERQHLKLVRLPIPPPGHGASSVWQAAALKGGPLFLSTAKPSPCGKGRVAAQFPYAFFSCRERVLARSLLANAGRLGGLDDRNAGGCGNGGRDMAI